MSKSDNTQIIFTTHSPSIGKMMPVNNLRLITKDSLGSKIDKPSDDIIEKIVETLGVFAEVQLKDIDKVKVAVCLEGKDDIEFIQRINSVVPEFKEIIDLNSPEVILLPLGGSTLKFWVNNEYLNKLKLAQVHIYDSDKGSTKPQKYREYVNKINQGERCKAFETKCREMENYITPAVLNELESCNIVISNSEQWESFDVLEAYAKYKHYISEAEKTWEELSDDKKKKKISSAKNAINTELVEMITKEKLCQYELFEEVEGWFKAIKEFV